MFWSVSVALILMSMSWTRVDTTEDVTGELSNPPNPTDRNGSVAFQQELKHFQSELQDLQSKYNVQQQENSHLQTTVSQLLTTVNQLQTTANQLQTTVTQLQTRVASQNATISDLENQSPNMKPLNYTTSVRDLQSAFAQIQDKVAAIDDVSVELKTSLLQSQEIQNNAMGIQGNVTDFLCEHFTHSNVSVSGNVTAGTAVVRGRDWTYGDQDGHDHHVRGVVLDKATPPGLVYVHWDHGVENIYRVGYAGGFDLYYYYPDILSKFRHVLCQN